MNIKGNLKVGDTVKVTKAPFGNEEYTGRIGKIVKIAQNIFHDDIYMLEGLDFYMLLSQLTLLPEYPKTVVIGGTKIIWNPPYTILIEDWHGEKVKSVTKCLEGDTFNERDGYMFALARLLMPEDVRAYFRERK